MSKSNGSAAGHDRPLPVAAATPPVRRQRLRAAAFALLPLLLLLPDFLGGRPGLVRIGWVLACSAGCALVLAFWVAGRSTGGQERPLGRAAGWLLAGAWTLAAVALSVAKYRAFGDFLAYDTAYYQQVLWNTAHGRFLQGSILQSLYYDPPLANDLGLHFGPALLLFLPFHALLPGPWTLLVLRDVLLGLAALPAYRLARSYLGDRAALAVAAALLLHPALIIQPVHGFYPVTIALLPLLWALVAYQERRPGLFLGMLALALLVREDVGVAVFGIGLMAAADRLLRRDRSRGWSWTLIPVLAGPAWLLLCTMVLMPHLGGQASGQAVMSWYAGHGSSPGEIAGRLLGDPAYAVQALVGTGHARWYYLYRLLRSFALLPLGGLASLGVLPGLAVNLLVTGEEVPTLHVACHYSILLLPLLFLGMLQTLSRLGLRLGGQRGLRAAACVVLFVAASALLDAYPRQELGRLVPPPQAASLRAAAALVPEGASIAASSHVLPAVAQGIEVYALERMFSSRIGRPEYVLLDLDRQRYYVRPDSEAALQDRIRSFLEDPAYERIYDRHGVLLLRRRPGL